MAIGTGNFSTRKAGYAAGIGVMIDLDQELPRKFDATVLGDGDAKGMALTGKVVSVLGAVDAASAPQLGTVVSIVVRPSDSRKAIFDDLVKTNESRRFLLEGVTGDATALEARWAHGAGGNRHIRALEIAGVPHVTFENPFPKDGPRNGYLRLNLDGSATEFDERLGDGSWTTREIPYDKVVERLKLALEQDKHFRVTQRVLEPSKSIRVNNQDELVSALSRFREKGNTSCVVRTFLPDTTDPNQVDVQILNWPQDIPKSQDQEGKEYEMPVLRETKRFATLRDGAAEAVMEVIPGYEISLVGNPSDASKSVKHKFVQDIVGKGLSNSQKNLYAAQAYGPGISIRAVNENSEILGLTRLISRTEGPQYRGLMTIPSRVFPAADKIVFKAADKPVEVPEATEGVPA